VKLFDEKNNIGIFKGFSEGGLEFHADLVLPYRSDFQSIPMHGQFLLVQLEDENEGVLGRITSLSAEGKLASGAGEDYGLRTVADNRKIPEDLREQYLKYRVNIRVLGILRSVNGSIVYAPSHRRLPHVGSNVAFLSDEVLKEITNENSKGAEIGWLALGEFIYAKGDERLKPLDWMRIIGPKVTPKFEISSLISRRTFVFARAGFGKSNLIKLLFSNLYKETPTVQKRAGKQVPVGTVLFDPDGEYFWPDDKGRPGLCDVPELKDKIVVFTQRGAPSPFYGSFVAGNVKLDIRRLKPSDVISIALSPEKQDQQNVRKLKGLNDQSWRDLVDIIHKSGNFAEEDKIGDILGLKPEQEAEIYAARANMTTIVKMLHDPSSLMMDMLLSSLKEGKLCIIDVSQVRGTSSLILSGLILQKIFEHNQGEFTKPNPDTIPVIMVVEEAQSVLGESSVSAGEGPYVSWVKEGRKYDLGAVLVTQQPGSISWQLLSQGDNWFLFHLLSQGDLNNVKKANSNFSSDILSSLLNEPIQGNGVFWSSASGHAYPIPIRVLSFEDMYSPLDPNYNKKTENVYAKSMSEHFKKELREMAKDTYIHGEVNVEAEGPAHGEEEGIDIMDIYVRKAVKNLSQDHEFMDKIKTDGIPWFDIQRRIAEVQVGVTDNDERYQQAYHLVSIVMNALSGGKQDYKWISEKRESKSKPGSMTTWVKIL
jgi:hypothetical protein